MKMALSLVNPIYLISPKGWIQLAKNTKLGNGRAGAEVKLAGFRALL